MSQPGPLVGLLEATLGYARARDYTGWDLYDGESSRLLRTLPVESKWLNLAVQQIVRRLPVNVRPLLLVERRRSFKGAALFAMANLNAYTLTGDAQYRAEARSLCEWLISNASDGYSGFCGGHQHPLQGLHGRIPAGTPDVVDTSFAARALLQANAVLDDDYDETAMSAAAFLREDLTFDDAPTGTRLPYTPIDDGTYYVPNGNALAARLLVDLYAHSGRQEFRSLAEELLDYVVSLQTDLGGWKYADPPSASHLSMDNFHNGFIVESLLYHRVITDSDRYRASLDDAYAFYRDRLFEADGAPMWDESSRYPRDIHSCAQGVLTFTLGGDIPRARQVLKWTDGNLSDGAGRFFFQKGRFVTKRITLMRWCQAWMAYAISELCVTDASELSNHQQATPATKRRRSERRERQHTNIAGVDHAE